MRKNKNDKSNDTASVASIIKNVQEFESLKSFNEQMNSHDRYKKTYLADIEDLKPEKSACLCKRDLNKRPSDCKTIVNYKNGDGSIGAHKFQQLCLRYCFSLSKVFSIWEKTGNN